MFRTKKMSYNYSEFYETDIYLESNLLTSDDIFTDMEDPIIEEKFKIIEEYMTKILMDIP